MSGLLSTLRCLLGGVNVDNSESERLRTAAQNIDLYSALQKTDQAAHGS